MNTYGIESVVVYPWANEKEAVKGYGVTLTRLEDVDKANFVIVAVAYNEFRKLKLDDIKKLYRCDITDYEK